jgi:uncharacterized protein (DUF58 family)
VPLALRRRLDRWLFQLRGPQAGPVVLVHRRVFILPTAHGLVYCTVLLIMLAGSINYGLSLGFVLTFLLGGLALNGMLYTFRNMANLRISGLNPRPVFAGETAQFQLRVENPANVRRLAIEALPAGGEIAVFGVAAQEETVVPLAVPAPRRGLLPIGRVMLQSRFPLGLFRAWSYVELDLACTVYPRPEQPPAPLPPPSGEHGDGAVAAVGDEDFAGLRAYHLGDSPRRIAWKADARGSGLLSKVFSGRADAHLWFDWHALPATLGAEERLSRLARWVLDADLQDAAYGLRLPGETIAPDAGPAHRDHCLRALALYESR